MLSKDILEELGLKKGELVRFEKVNGRFVLKKIPKKKDRLIEIARWDPPRTGKPRLARPEEMKMF
ncbi:MAG: hypothetical protein HY929_01200 [Euryarchaeota archaeon]|nr:hypothetical protein [Euryarchaeota archaeon]